MRIKLLDLLVVLCCCVSKYRHAEIKVSGNCEMCKERIEAALHLPGVQNSSWDSENKILEVNFDETKISLKTIRQKIADAGHDTDSVKASNHTYQHLHECCRYREENP